MLLCHMLFCIKAIYMWISVLLRSLCPKIAVLTDLLSIVLFTSEYSTAHKPLSTHFRYLTLMSVLYTVIVKFMQDEPGQTSQ
jgi:ABC-type transport system involved in cytochrome c biogenesis permease subunit